MEPWWVWGVIGVVVVLGLVVAQRFGWIDLRNKGRSSGAGGLAVVDEIFAPTRHEARIEVEAQTRLPAPAPLPGDGAGKRDIYRGAVRIDLDEGSNTER